MDMGASAHMTSGSGNLCSTSPLVPSSHIVVGNGSKLPITHSGFVLLPTSTTSTFLLHNVLVAPTLLKNLISVRSFARDNSAFVEFDSFGFSIKDPRTKVEIVRYDNHGDLYPLSPNKTATHLRLSWLLLLLPTYGISGSDVLTVKLCPAHFAPLDSAAINQCHLTVMLVN